jgi:hypothetical protein
MLRSLRVLATTAALAAIVPAGAQENKPLTVKQVAKNVQAEARRVGNRTEDVVRKAGNQTEKQAQRTGKSVARVVSRDARQGDYEKFDFSDVRTGGELIGADPRPSPSMDPSKPVTVKQVAKNTQSEVQRAGNRTEDAVRKAGNQTEAQAKRQGNWFKRLFSREARREARAGSQ